jgi:hypothetical protein
MVSEEQEASLPTTLQQFSTSQHHNQPKIFDPPKAPENPKETAPQRYLPVVLNFIVRCHSYNQIWRVVFPTKRIPGTIFGVY